MSMPVGDWLGRRALYTPHKEGLVVMPGAQNAGLGSPGAEPLRLTFDAWNRRANQMAHFLQTQDVGKGDRVSVLAQNCAEMLDLLFACGKLGAVFVPYNWRSTESELIPLVKDTDPKLLIYGPHFSDTARRINFSPSANLAEMDMSRFSDRPLPDCGLQLEDPWMILYTGGTTGRSKGAILSHRLVIWNAWNTIAGWGLSPEDKVPIVTPFFHTGGLNVLTTPLVQLGGTSVLMGPFDPGEVLEVIEEEQLTLLFMVPTMFQMMMEHPKFAETDFSRLRLVISGGAPCPLPVYEAFWAKGVTFRSGYGLTEVGPNNFGMPDHEVKRKVGSVGFPLFHVGMRIMNEDRECGPGEVGELQIAGEHVCSGYWQDPEDSKTANPDGWFRTGDLAYRDVDGFYYIVDRKKDMYISGGENVYPAEIEAVLYQHPAVAEAAVVGVPDAVWGEVGKAFVVCRPGTQLTEAQLMEHCRRFLAGYKIPKSVMLLDMLPKSAAGKILKRELRQLVR